MEKTAKFIRKCQYLIDNDELEYIHNNFIDLYQKCMESEEFLSNFGNRNTQKDEDATHVHDNIEILEAISEKMDLLCTQLSQKSSNDNIKDYIQQKFDSMQANICNIGNVSDANIMNAINNLNVKIEQQSQTTKALEMFQDIFKQTSKTVCTSSSPELGIKGESEMIKLLQDTFPKYEILNAAETNHSGDIIVIDHESKIKYVFEIKNKQSITANDIEKYAKDVKTMTDEFYKIYGIFISLNTDNIPHKGSYLFEDNLFYLGKRYVSKEVLTLIINHLIPIKENIVKTKENVIKHTYEIDMAKLDLILNIKKQATDMKDLYQNILEEIKNNSNSRGNLLKMKDVIESYMHRLTDLTATFTLNDEETDVAKQRQMTAMKEYIRKKSKTFKKDELKKEFPLCLSIILGKKVDELRKWSEE